MSIDRLGIHFGSFIVYFYALITLLGVLVACFLTVYRAKKYKQDPEMVWDLATWVLIAGIVGARLWHILLPSASQIANGITAYYYLTHPLDAINIRSGGMGIPGAVIGGAIALLIFARAKKLSFWTWTDMIAPGLIIAQAIGRWGNFVNQELYGAPSTLPWAIFIEPVYRLPEFRDVATYHPLFLYEFIWNVFIFLALLWIEQQFAKRLMAGDIFLVYLVGYPIGRFFLEFLRLDTAIAFGVDFNQLFMLVIAIAAIGWLIWRHRGQEGVDQEIDINLGALETKVTGSEEPQSEGSPDKSSGD